MQSSMAHSRHASQMVLDSEESKNVAVVHKTNQGFSGKDLWKLKLERPDLFSGQSAAADSSLPSAPPGYVDVPALGRDWLFNREKGVYMQRETRKQYVADPETSELVLLGRGRDMTATLSVHGDAAASVGSGGAASRHVIIGDLHRAAASMKLDFAHHDSPAAMFAVYDGQASSAVAEAAAKGLHVRLLPRLAEYRGEWDPERLERVIADSIRQLSAEIGAEGGLALGVAVLLGGRLVFAAQGGAMCMLFGRDGGGDGGMDDVDVVGSGPDVTTQCAVLQDSHLGVFLSVNAVRQTPSLGASRLRALARGHMAAERPRAACITVLGEARRAEAKGPLVAAAARFAWQQLQDPDAPPSKRARTDPSKLTKVRCRHILLRHSAATAQGDRGKPKATRTSIEAEDMLLRFLPELGMGGPAAFTAKCKKESDCETALRGGDLAGDLGWLDKDPAKNRKVPAAVTRAAFQVAVGQLSDIISSERGMHLLLRTA